MGALKGMKEEFVDPVQDKWGNYKGFVSALVTGDMKGALNNLNDLSGKNIGRVYRFAKAAATLDVGDMSGAVAGLAAQGVSIVNKKFEFLNKIGKYTGLILTRYLIQH